MAACRETLAAMLQITPAISIEEDEIVSGAMHLGKRHSHLFEDTVPHSVMVVRTDAFCLSFQGDMEYS